MSRAPTVTVVIPVCNREKYVAEAIDSILAQSFREFELLLVDDGSTDASREVMRSYTDPRIRLVCNESNLGIAKTRNKGVRLARGEYLAILDSDDHAYPHRLARQVAFLDRHPDHALVGSWVAWMDGDGRSLRRTRRQPVSAEEIRARLLFGPCIPNTSIMARTALLRDYGYREQYVVLDDYDFLVRLSGEYKLASLPEVLVRYRTHAEGISQGNSRARVQQNERCAIVGAQLAALGVAFTETDLARHTLLSHRQPTYNTGRSPVPDRAYLEWADAWLCKLQEANHQTARYPEPAFSRVLQERWFKACRRASTQIGWTAWRRCWQSPLRAGVWQLVFGTVPRAGRAGTP